MTAFTISTDGLLEGTVIKAGAGWVWTCLIDGATGTAATDWQAAADLTAAWRAARKNLVFPSCVGPR